MDSQEAAAATAGDSIPDIEAPAIQDSKALGKKAESAEPVKLPSSKLAASTQYCVHVEKPPQPSDPDSEMSTVSTPISAGSRTIAFSQLGETAQVAKSTVSVDQVTLTL